MTCRFCLEASEYWRPAAGHYHLLYNIEENLYYLFIRGTSLTGITSTYILFAVGESYALVFPQNQQLRRYERSENSPSVEVAVKIAKAFDIPIDYLLGEGKHATYSKDTMKRIEEIEAMDDKQNLFSLISLIHIYAMQRRVRRMLCNAHKRTCLAAGSSLYSIYTFVLVNPWRSCHHTNTNNCAGSHHPLP
jgi:transcriptional regulator with XRE-family HTH domain